MKNQPTTSNSGALARFLRATSIVRLLPALVLLLSIQSGRAGSATWKTFARTGNWDAAQNWTPLTVPNGPTDTATFNTSNETAPFLSANTEVNGIGFNAGASAFTITASSTFTLTLSGVGITNNSGINQNFVSASHGIQNSGVIEFANNATAGSGTVFTIEGGGTTGLSGPGGRVFFRNSATAGNGKFINNAGMQNNSGGGVIEFFDTSTAANGTFTNKGSAFDGTGGFIYFNDSSTADHGTFTNGPAVNTAGVTVGTINFIGANSTAGNGTFINNGGTSGGGGVIIFDGGTAGNGTFTINGGAGSFGSSGGIIIFEFSTTAGNGTFTVNGGAVSGAGGGLVEFNQATTAGDATLILNGGAVSGAGGSNLEFTSTSTAGNAKLSAKGDIGAGKGSGIVFFNDTTGGTSQMGIFDNAILDISFRNFPGITVGSLEGSGAIFLGARNLTVGSNNLNTTFSGVIQDGGSNGGTGGALSKIGSGKLVLSNANTYTGGTTITKGALLVTNKTGSATGTAPLQVNSGTLGGKGRISGAVTVGNGSNSGAILLPGTAKKPGTLTINSTLTFKSLSTYRCVLNRATPAAGKVNALGVTINSGATFTFVDTTTGTLTTGTVFTVINNTSATPIAGTFSNLANGAVFASNGNNFQVSYTGGTGNDLTLTVVP